MILHIFLCLLPGKNLNKNQCTVNKHADIFPSVVPQTPHLFHHFPEVLPLNLPIRMIVDKLVESFSHLNKS